MKKIFGLITVALLALFTTSCFEQTAVIRLNKDGSGTITETTLLSAEASAMLGGLGGGGGGEDPLAKMADKDKAAAAAKKMGEGVEVEKVAQLDKDGRKGAEVVYRFKDINKVKFNMGSSMSEASKGMVPEGADAPKQPEQKPVTFKYADGVLTLANPASKPDPAAAPAEIDPAQLQQMQQMKGMFKGMRMTFKLEFPGGIAESTATHVSGNTVTIADMEFEKLLDDPEKFKKLATMKDPSEAAALFKDTPGLKVESKEEFTVKLK